MPQTILDTSRLVSWWRDRAKADGRPLDMVTMKNAEAWANALLEWRPGVIVSPVEIEFLAGARSSHELQLFRSYLAQFENIDEGKILPQDWKKASQYAARVPRNRKPRHFGDCLIQAIADRLHCVVDTLDQHFAGK